MEFWIIQAQENPPASRADSARRKWRSNTLAEILADRGHTVVRWRSSFSHQAKEQLVEGSVRISTENYYHQYIAAPGYCRHVGIGRILSHIALARNFRKIASSYPRPPDLIHVANVPIELCCAVVSYAREVNVPVIVDIRDLWPDSYADHLPATEQIRKVVRNWLRNRKGRLGKCLSYAAAITGLTQAYLDWGLSKSGREQSSNDVVFSMGYSKPELQPCETTVAELRARLKIKPDDVLACYFGNIGYQSDFEALISCADYLAISNPKIKFVIAGSGPLLGRLEALAEGKSNVILPGWLETSDIHALMQEATFGLIAYKSVPNFLMNVPNKFAEYLAGGLIIACSLKGEMGRLVIESGCGFVYDIGDPSALGDQLSDLLADPLTLKAMSRRAKSLHKEKFDGDKIYQEFADYLENMSLGNSVRQRTWHHAK